MAFPSLKLASLVLSAAAFSASGFAAQTPAQAAPHGRVVLVLPFENRSGNSSLNWVGDSLPDTIDGVPVRIEVVGTIRPR